MAHYGLVDLFEDARDMDGEALSLVVPGLTWGQAGQPRRHPRPEGMGEGQEDHQGSRWLHDVRGCEGFGTVPI